MVNHLNVAEWIIVGILSFMLFLFLLLAVILLVKLIKISNQAKKIMETGQSIAEKTEDVVDNVKDMTSVGGLVKGFTKEYVGRKFFGYEDKKSRRKKDDDED
jgi:hypothetical protein